MDWKSHLVFGVVSGAIVSFLLGLALAPAVAFSLISGAAALLPDIDARKSKITQLAIWAGIALLLMAAWLWSDARALEFAFAAAAAWVAIWLLSFFGPGHRTITHTFWFALAAAAACFLFAGWQIALAVLLGMLSHLAADGFPRR